MVEPAARRAISSKREPRRVIRDLRSTTGLLAGSALLFACGASAEAERLDWPELRPESWAFVVHEDARRTVLGPFPGEGPEAPLILSDARAWLLELETPAVQALHPFIELSDWRQASLESPEPSCQGCAQACLGPERDRVEAAPPSDARVWRREAGEPFSAASFEGWPPLHLRVPADVECMSSRPAELELVAELPRDRDWVGTLPAGPEAAWAWGSDLLWVGLDGRTHALSTVRASGWISDVVADSDGSFLVSTGGPSEVLRVRTSSSGIVVQNVWSFEAPNTLALAPNGRGGFVVIADREWVVWVSESGEPVRSVDTGLGRGLRAIIASPFVPGEVFVSAGFGNVWSGDPFAVPPRFEDLRVAQVDKQIWRFAVRPGPSGPEIWAGTNEKGLYHRGPGDAEWRLPEVSTLPRADNCAKSSGCGFHDVTGEVQEMDVAGRDVVASADGCPAILWIRPERGCATRLELPPERTSLKAFSGAEGWLWALDGKTLLRVRLE